MRLLSLIAAMVATAAITIYAMTCSVNNVPPAPVHPIVGKWQLIVVNGHATSPELYLTNEYTLEGLVFQESNDPKNKHIKTTGSYTVRNDVLHTSYQMFRGASKNYECRIVELSEVKLVVIATNSIDNEESSAVYKKITK